MNPKSRNGKNANLLDHQTQLKFNSDLLVLDKVEEDDSPEESDRYHNQKTKIDPNLRMMSKPNSCFLHHQ